MSSFSWKAFASKAGWVAATLLGITLVAAWAGIINAGPLDPSGPVGPSMKSLDDIPGSWSRMLSSEGADPCATERFDCVLNDGAVLDRETGLVWVRAPETDTMDWGSAVRECETENHGGRLGFRLPTISELLTLADVNEISGLPAASPFTVGTEDYFWSSTEDVVSPLNRAMKYDFTTFDTASELKDSGAFRVWCVRGSGGGDLQ